MMVSLNVGFASTSEVVAQNMHYLPNGDTLNVTTMSDGSNHVYTSSGTTIVIDDAQLQSVISGSITLDIMTEEEKKELADLEKEKEVWIRQQKLKGFQKLPAHIRQEVVDEAYVKDFLNEMNNVDGNNFENQQRINELQNKQQNQVLIDGLGVRGSNMWYNYQTTNSHTHYLPTDNMIFKYGKIINEFSTEELAEAHSAATIEENLTDD